VVSQPYLVDAAQDPVQITASMGATVYPVDRSDADTLLRHADQAMYRAKEAGKNRYLLLDPETDRQAQAHRQQLARLQRALDCGEFELHYQPKVDLASGALRGAEGLIRWRDPDRDSARGLVPPGEFLPVLEGSPLEHAVGDWVIATGLAQAEAWHDQGLALTVSVNVGANQLLRHDFADRLAVALARHPRLPRSAFELEVLETAAIADIAQAVSVMERCRALGVRFALDDFGTGYSSLTYLRRLPIDTLKIDQSFVRRMLDDAEDCGIVEGVIRLAAAFGREVIAEGVETAAHGERLLALGCRHGQGHGIARPMPADRLAPWVAERALGAVLESGDDRRTAPPAVPARRLA
jgi:EAL domain-containing protein (putative c-di-GMP-specific phosphodiesterase class I)